MHRGLSLKPAWITFEKEILWLLQGRPPKVSEELKKTIFEERPNSTINKLAKKYNLGIATIYRIMAEMKE